MTKIVFNCTSHGALEAQDCYTVRKKTGRINYQCKVCKVEKIAAWREKNQASYMQGRRDYQKTRLNRNCTELNDSYIKKRLRLPGIEIPQALIDLKRATLELKRVARAKKRKDLEDYMHNQFIKENTNCN